MMSDFVQRMFVFEQVNSNFTLMLTNAKLNGRQLWSIKVSVQRQKIFY